MKPENFIKFMKDSGLTEKEIDQVQTFLCNPGSGLTTAEIKLKCLELAVDKSDPAFNSDKTFALAGRFAEFVLGETCKQSDDTLDDHQKNNHTDNDMNKTRIRRAKNIPILLVERLYWAAIHFRDFIEMQPLDTPVLWIGDRKTKVTDIQSYKVSCESVKLFESYVNSETMGACEFCASESTKTDEDEPQKNTDWYESLLCTTGKEGTVYRKRTSFESARTILPILNRGELAPAWIETYYRRSSQSGRV